MERFEYKLVKAPQKSNKYSGLNKLDDKFAHTLMDSMNDIASDGWQFLRKEVMTETKRRGFFGRKSTSHDYLVYRRQLRGSGMSMDTPVSPRRIQKAKSPDIEQLRARISQAMLPPNIQAANNQ